MTDLQELRGFSIEGAAAALEMHPGSIRRWCIEGKVPAIKVGRRWRIPKDVVEALVQGLPAPARH